MYQKSRLEKQSDNVAPVDHPIEGIQFAAVVKAVKNERNQAEDIKVNCARRIPAASENKQADEQIQECRKSEIILDRRRVFLRGGYQRRFKSSSVPTHPVSDFSPRAHLEQHARHVRGSMNRETPNRLHVIALFDSGSCSRRICNHMP